MLGIEDQELMEVEVPDFLPGQTLFCGNVTTTSKGTAAAAATAVVQVTDGGVQLLHCVTLARLGEPWRPTAST